MATVRNPLEYAVSARKPMQYKDIDFSKLPEKDFRQHSKDIVKAGLIPPSTKLQTELEKAVYTSMHSGRTINVTELKDNEIDQAKMYLQSAKSYLESGYDKTARGDYVMGERWSLHLLPIRDPLKRLTGKELQEYKDFKKARNPRNVSGKRYSALFAHSRRRAESTNPKTLPYYRIGSLGVLPVKIMSDKGDELVIKLMGSRGGYVKGETMTVPRDKVIGVTRHKHGLSYSGTFKNPFTQTQLDMLRTAYAPLKTAPASALSKFHAIFAKMQDDELKQVVKAKINFVSKLALNEAIRRGLTMESVMKNPSTKLPKGQMFVYLASAPNVDISGGYWSPGKRPAPQWVAVKSLKDAQHQVEKYIYENDIGAGNWIGGDIRVGTKHIGYVSFNGRIWAGKKTQLSMHKEIKVNPKNRCKNPLGAELLIINPGKRRKSMKLRIRRMNKRRKSHKVSRVRYRKHLYTYAALVRKFGKRIAKRVWSAKKHRKATAGATRKAIGHRSGWMSLVKRYGVMGAKRRYRKSRRGRR